MNFITNLVGSLGFTDNPERIVHPRRGLLNRNNQRLTVGSTTGTLCLLTLFVQLATAQSTNVQFSVGAHWDDGKDTNGRPAKVIVTKPFFRAASAAMVHPTVVASVIIPRGLAAPTVVSKEVEYDAMGRTNYTYTTIKADPRILKDFTVVPVSKIITPEGESVFVKPSIAIPASAYYQVQVATNKLGPWLDRMKFSSVEPKAKGWLIPLSGEETNNFFIRVHIVQ